MDRIVYRNGSGYSPTMSMTEKFRNDCYEDDMLIIEDVSDEYTDDDQMQMTPWKKTAFKYIPLTLCATNLFNLIATYLERNILNESLNPELAQPGMGYRRLWLFFWQGVTVILFILSLWTLIPMAKTWRPRLRLGGANVPSVDIIITCCNEELDIILDTVKAALTLDYPKSRYRVIVSDDGNSLKLKEAISELALDNNKSSYPKPSLYYTARLKSGPCGYKGGNLNHAFQFLCKLPEGAAEFIAGLDADMIPERRWLRAMMPHLLQNPDMGVVCPPQYYYNAPLNDPLNQCLVLRNRCEEIVKDMMGVAWCGGTGWVIRHEAWIDIGGFPTYSLTEDVALTMELLKFGWKSAYIPEALQYGLIPDTFYGHVKQRVRWVIGGCQIGMHNKFYNPLAGRGRLTFPQRLVAFYIHMGELRNIPILFGRVVDSVFFFSGYSYIYYKDVSQMRAILRLRCLQALLGWGYDLHQSILAGYEVVIRERCQGGCLWLPCGIAVMRLYLPSWLGGKVGTFTSTGSIPRPLNERDASARSTMKMRLKGILIDSGAIYQLVLVVLCAVGVAYRIWTASQKYPGDWHAVVIELLCAAACPPLPWVNQVVGDSIPLMYSLFPPDVPERDRSMELDPVTYVRRPTTKAKQYTWSFAASIYSQMYTLTMLYTFCIFLGTWWI